MEVYTLNIGQGQFVVLTSKNQAIIIDTYVPLSSKNSVINIKAALSKILQGKELVGLIITGFDNDHFDEVGLRIILNKYRPNWIMYPKYYKQTKNADLCFDIINEFNKNSKNIEKLPVKLTQNSRRFYTKQSNDFGIEIFSPHEDDMDSSNNCSIVAKIKCNHTQLTYLVTGDTENSRWNSIAHYFGKSIKSDILDAPHHGSKNGISEDAMKLIAPHTVLISAGDGYGHPDKEAMVLFKKYASKVLGTNINGGISLLTKKVGNSITTYKFEP